MRNTLAASAQFRGVAWVLRCWAVSFINDAHNGCQRQYINILRVECFFLFTSGDVIRRHDKLKRMLAVHQQMIVIIHFRAPLLSGTWMRLFPLA